MLRRRVPGSQVFLINLIINLSLCDCTIYTLSTQSTQSILFLRKKQKHSSEPFLAIGRLLATQMWKDLTK